jgi:hypothetical protein
VSTVKADAITAVSTNADLSLDGLGTGGVSIASTLKMTKGGDIASASPLVIDTDGNYFDITGTTNFSAMTVESGNFFMLQFDGALTITHGSGIELPGAANLTTAAGDRLICYATAANTVEVMSVETEAAASAGGFTHGTEQATTSGTSVTFSSIPADTDLIYVMFDGTSFDGGTDMLFTLGDAGGLETSGYISHSERAGVIASSTASFILNLAELHDAFDGMMILAREDGNTWVASYVTGMGNNANTSFGAGSKTLSAELTQLSIFNGTFDNGAVNIMYM